MRGKDPTDENMKYYADLGYHVQNVTWIASNNGETKLVMTGVPNTYDNMLREFLAPRE